MSNLTEHLINLDLQETLSNEYEIGNYSLINSKRPVDQPDSKIYSIDFDLLQEYLNYVKQNAKVETSKITININMGQYPKGEFDPRLNRDYKGYQTIFVNASQSIGDPAQIETLNQIDGLDFVRLTPP